MTEVQGVGVYAEFGNNSGVSQLLITPDGLAEDGTYVSASVVRRLFIPSGTAEPEWMIAVLPTNGTMGDEAREVAAATRFKSGTALLDQYVNGSWTHLGTPFFVEVSSKDLSDLGEGRSPQKLLHRVRLCRLELGYPEEGKTR